MENLSRVISEHPFCKDLESPYVDLLVGCSGSIRVPEGLHLFRAGSEANQFYLIREGKILLEIPSAQSPSPKPETVEAGEVLGWSWLVPPYRWCFGARAIEPVSAISMSGKCIRAKCEKNSDLGYVLLKKTVEMLGRHSEATRIRLFDLYSAGTGMEQPLLISRLR